jgi:DNA-binding IclR family transcriptional regulator
MLDEFDLEIMDVLSTFTIPVTVSAVTAHTHHKKHEVFACLTALTEAGFVKATQHSKTHEFLFRVTQQGLDALVGDT